MKKNKSVNFSFECPESIANVLALHGKVTSLKKNKLINIAVSYFLKKKDFNLNLLNNSSKEVKISVLLADGIREQLDAFSDKYSLKMKQIFILSIMNFYHHNTDILNKLSKIYIGENSMTYKKIMINKRLFIEYFGEEKYNEIVRDEFPSTESDETFSIIQHKEWMELTLREVSKYTQESDS
jgi:hypothetical protein